MRRPAMPSSAEQRTVRRPSIGMCPMRRPVLVPVPVAIISSSRNSVPSKKTTSARAIRSHHRRSDGCSAGNIGEAGAAGRNLDADIGGGLARGVGVVALEIERHLARHREQPRLQSARQAPASRPGTTARRVTTSGASTPNMAIVSERGQRGGGGANCKRLALAQAQQAGHLIDLGAGEHDRLDRAAARCRARMQRLGSAEAAEEGQGRR